MSWLSSLPDPHVVSEVRYYDQREAPDEPDAIEVQLHKRIIKEYRGLTLDAAQNAANPATYSNGYKSYEITAIEGGGYTLTETIDYTEGPWVKVKYTIG